MKKALVFLLLFSSTLLSKLKAQDLSVAVEYMSYLSSQQYNIQADYMAYTSAVAHGKSARKVDNRRQALLQTVENAIVNAKEVPAFEGNKALRDSLVACLKLTQLVLTEDYSKILDMEEIAEQSYDAMEAYMLAQDLAQAKLSASTNRFEEAYRKFAEKNNVTIIESEDKLSNIITITNKVNLYHKKLYLIFFKSFKQGVYLNEAIEANNINSIEQNKNTLLKYAEEGLKKIEEIAPFEEDGLLKEGCQQYLVFARNHAQNTVPELVDFFMKKENMEKLQKAMEQKKQAQKTNDDITSFNNAIDEYNASIKTHNNLINNLNKNSSKATNGWNTASTNFLDKHTPKYKNKR